MVGLNGKPKTYVHEFTIKKNDQKKIQDLENEIKKIINGYQHTDLDTLLAALAKIGADILENAEPISKNQEVSKKKAKL